MRRGHQSRLHGRGWYKMNETKKFHETLDLLGLRAQATAAGLIQLTVELNRAGVLDDAAMVRIKDSIFGEISLRRPIAVPKDEYDRSMRRRLDALFAGTERMGDPPPAVLTGGRAE
jgi:hypothetical protein